ncbi:MAG: NTF2-like N-terminal transpeptidase domain-containing protein [Candidatus Pacearchaeota archaeon]
MFQENLAKQNRPNMNRDKFHFSVKNAFNDATVKAIEIKEINRNVSLFSKEGVIKFRVRYFTQDLGYFEQQKQAKIIKEDGQWKIIWDWDLIFDGLTENSKIETLIDIGTRGTIIDNKGNILAEDKEGYMISLNPEIINLKKEQEMLELLGKISGIKPVHLQNAYLENVIAGTYVPLFTLYTSLTPELRNRLLAFPGIRIDQHNARIYDIAKLDSNSIENTIYKECCTRIYSAYNYHGVYGIEKKYDSILWGHSGGSIKIIDKKGNVVKNVLSLDKKDGETVVLSL